MRPSVGLLAREGEHADGDGGGKKGRTLDLSYRFWSRQSIDWSAANLHGLRARQGVRDRIGAEHEGDSDDRREPGTHSLYLDAMSFFCSDQGGAGDEELSVPLAQDIRGATRRSSTTHLDALPLSEVHLGRVGVVVWQAGLVLADLGPGRDRVHVGRGHEGRVAGLGRGGRHGRGEGDGVRARVVVGWASDRNRPRRSSRPRAANGHLDDAPFPPPHPLHAGTSSSSHARMARTHKGGGPPRRSPNGAAPAPSAALASSGSSSAQRTSPLKPSTAPVAAAAGSSSSHAAETSAAAGLADGLPSKGKHRVVLDAAMIRALVGDVAGGSSGGSRGRAEAEVEHVGLKCPSPFALLTGSLWLEADLPRASLVAPATLRSQSSSSRRPSRTQSRAR